MLKVAIAALVGAMLISVINAIVYGLLIPDVVDANRTAYEGLFRDKPHLVAYFLFGLLWMSMLAYAFEYWANIRNFARGAVAGAVFWAAVVLGINLAYIYNFHLLENVFVIVPIKIATAAVAGAIVGGVMGTILGWRAGSEAPGRSEHRST